MKIILSRKGFDSEFGGVASPVFTEGEKFLSLPIPAKRSEELKELGYNICYNDLNYHGHSYGQLVQDLTRKRTKKKLTGDMLVHLDPDIMKDVYQKRHKDWKPLFGQDSAAQGHLRIEGVSKGDIFLFFGLYRWVKQENGLYSYEKNKKPFHMLWGWMQIEDIIPLYHPEDTKHYHPEDNYQEWMEDHPHCYQKDENHKALYDQNTLYMGSKDLIIDNKVIIKNGGTGIFDTYRDELQLTRKESDHLTDWLVPAFIYNKDEKKLPSLHQNKDRWKKEGDKYNLTAVSKGQEFVFDCDDHPGATDWIIKLINKGI